MLLADTCSVLPSEHQHDCTLADTCTLDTFSANSLMHCCEIEALVCCMQVDQTVDCRREPAWRSHEQVLLPVGPREHEGV